MSEQDFKTILSVENVTKKYKNELACDDVSFALPAGSVTVLLGPNGAGKSTIMKSIIGFLRYTGNITVAGHPNKSIEAKRVLGYMPEIPSLYPNLTVAEHMEFVARAYRLENYRPFMNELLERFELLDKTNKFGDELSKGMSQKLSLCCALLPQPKLMLMDEPMIGLDPHAIKELKVLMGEMKKNGQTLLVSTHIIDSMDRLWDHAVIMQKGHILGNVTRADLEAQGRTLEDEFFALTEGISESDMYSLTEEKEA